MMASAGGAGANFVLYTQTDYTGTANKYSQTNPMNVVSDGTYAYVNVLNRYWDGTSNNYLAMSVFQIDQSGSIGWSKDYYKGTNISANQYAANYQTGSMELHNGYLYFSCFDNENNRIVVKVDASNGETVWSNTVYTAPSYSDYTFDSFVGPGNYPYIMLSSGDYGSNSNNNPRDGEMTLQEISMSNGLNNGWYGNYNTAMQGTRAYRQPGKMKGAGHPNNNWFVCGISQYSTNQGSTINMTVADATSSDPSGEYGSYSMRSAYPYGNSRYEWGGFKWANDTQFLSWGFHAREDNNVSTAQPVAAVLGLYSWNNTNHVSAFQKGVSYDGVGGVTPRGYPVLDSDGYWQMGAGGPASNQFHLMKASQSGSSISPVDCMKMYYTGGNTYMASAQAIATDDGGGVWVIAYATNSNNNGDDGFIFRINSDWDVNKPADVVTTDYGGTNHSWLFTNGLGGTQRNSAQHSNVGAGWADSVIEGFSANNSNTYLPVDDHAVQYNQFTGEESI